MFCMHGDTPFSGADIRLASLLFRPALYLLAPDVSNPPLHASLFSLDLLGKLIVWIHGLKQWNTGLQSALKPLRW